MLPAEILKNIESYLSSATKILFQWTVWKTPFPKSLCSHCLRSVGLLAPKEAFLFLKSSLITKKQLCFSAGFFGNMKLIESIDQRYTLDCMSIYLGAAAGSQIEILNTTFVLKRRYYTKKTRNLRDYIQYYKKFMEIADSSIIPFIFVKFI